VSSTSAILVVEDEPSVRRFVRSVLTRRGYTVLQASGGLEAISLMLSFDGDIPLVISDIDMPGVNGFDFANQLQIDRPSTEVLYMSGLTGSVAVDSIRRVKPQSILEKPFSPEELLARVEAILTAPAGPAMPE
jgi:two-component system cell cycle sensor histidine kinase/response regulator CckA